jgi:two-component system, NarL family, nitrate/nitrite response regulator NarL
MNKPNKISLGIADDHELFIEGLCNLLNFKDEFEIKYKVKSIDELNGQLNKSEPEILILDYFMGKEIVEKFLISKLEKKNNSKTIILTTGIGHEAAKKCFQLGVSCILPKDLNIEELIKIIHSVNDGYIQNFNSYLKSNTISYLNSTVYSESLTIKENQILELLCEGKISKEIADILSLSEFTVSTHRRNIKNKLRGVDLPPIIKACLRM